MRKICALLAVCLLSLACVQEASAYPFRGALGVRKASVVRKGVGLNGAANRLNGLNGVNGVNRLNNFNRNRVIFVNGGFVNSGLGLPLFNQFEQFIPQLLPQFGINETAVFNSGFQESFVGGFNGLGSLGVSGGCGNGLIGNNFRPFVGSGIGGCGTGLVGNGLLGNRFGNGFRFANGRFIR